MPARSPALVHARPGPAPRARHGRRTCSRRRPGHVLLALVVAAWLPMARGESREVGGAAEAIGDAEWAGLLANEGVGGRGGGAAGAADDVAVDGGMVEWDHDLAVMKDEAEAEARDALARAEEEAREAAERDRRAEEEAAARAEEEAAARAPSSEEDGEDGEGEEEADDGAWESVLGTNDDVVLAASKIVSKMDRRLTLALSALTFTLFVVTAIAMIVPAMFRSWDRSSRDGEHEQDGHGAVRNVLPVVLFAVVAVLLLTISAGAAAAKRSGWWQYYGVELQGKAKALLEPTVAMFGDDSAKPLSPADASSALQQSPPIGTGSTGLFKVAASRRRAAQTRRAALTRAMRERALQCKGEIKYQPRRCRGHAHDSPERKEEIAREKARAAAERYRSWRRIDNQAKLRGWRPDPNAPPPRWSGAAGGSAATRRSSSRRSLGLRAYSQR